MPMVYPTMFGEELTRLVYRTNPILNQAMKKKESLIIEGPEQYKLPFESSALESPVAPPSLAQQTPSNTSTPCDPLSSPF